MGMIKIHNVTGSSRYPKPSTGEDSWLVYWEAHKYPIIFFQCPGCGSWLTRDHFDGCHVQKYGSEDRSWYIIPMCDSCNHKTNDIFEIDENLLVPVPSNLE